MFHSENFGGVSDKCSSSKGLGSDDGRNILKHSHSSSTEYWGDSGDVDSFCSDRGFNQDHTAEEGTLLSKYQREQQLFTHFGSLDDLYYDVVSPPLHLCQDDITKLVGSGTLSETMDVVEEKKEKPPLSSFNILSNYQNRLRRLNGDNICVPNYGTTCTEASDRKLWTGAILRLAGENFIQFHAQNVQDLSMIGHPFASSLLGLSDEETKDVELVQCLLASAEKVGHQQFDHASKLLDQCDDLSSEKGNPFQRLVYYFSESLREKIEKETGRSTSKGSVKKQLFDVDVASMSPDPAVIAFYQALPFTQVGIFTAIQAIVDNVAAAKKVHMIDLEIRCGVHCAVLMRALAARGGCPLEHLKVTAVGTKSKSKIEATGKWLISFAESMNIPFSFKVVVVADMLDLSEDLFELDHEEAVAVYSPYVLRSMLAWPDLLECLMRVIRIINPCVMSVIEVDGNCNSPVFVNRFVEALFFFGAIFDSLKDCLGHDEPNRKILESSFFGEAIRNIVSAEGEARTTRHVNMNVWRAFFAQFGMVEMELSMPSLYQASLVLKNFPCGSSCTLDVDGKCLIIGWKGTPHQSLSTWKFL